MTEDIFTCKECETGFFLSPVDQIEKRYQCTVIPDIETFNSTCQVQKTNYPECQICKQNFFLSEKLCSQMTMVNCSLNIQNLNKCEICSIGYYLESENCQKASVENCKIYKANSNECEECVEDYYVKDNVCQKQTYFFPDNCKKVSNQGEEECIECQNQTVSENEIAFQVLEICESKQEGCEMMDPATHICVKCEEGYSGKSDKTCFKEGEIYDLNLN